MNIPRFFARVTEELHAKIPEARVSLCKQVHCDPELLRNTHRSWIDVVGRLKAQTDPNHLLTSRHLQALLAF